MASSLPEPPDDDMTPPPGYSFPWDWGGHRFECRCVECDERFESSRPDLLCERCDYLNSLDGDE